MINNLPPCSIEAEEAILGALLFDPRAVEVISRGLPEKAFFVEAHRLIFSAVLYLNSQNKGTDLISVSTHLSDQGILERVGGTTKLSQLLNRTVSARNIDRHALLVMEKYQRRELIVLGAKISSLGHDQTEELNEVYKKIRAILPKQLSATPQLPTEPTIVKAKYTVTSSSGLHKFELEADVSNSEHIQDDIASLKDKAEAIGEKLWDEYIAPNEVI